MTRAPHLASVAVLLLVAAPVLAFEPRPMPATLSFTPGEVVLLVDADRVTRGPGPAQLADPRMTEALARLGLEPVPGAGLRSRGALLTLKARSARPGFDPVAAAAELAATGLFRAACPNYRFPLFVLPSDEDLAAQWAIHDGGIADIQLPAAWDIQRGDSALVMAVLDTGIDTGHPDLASRIWHNPGEVPGNGLDDDGNGFDDDTTGWDFGRDDADPNPEYIPDDSGIDVGFHGSFVAGIMGAATNNTEGIAGATWRGRLMPVKVAHPDSGITAEALAGAFAYAADNGASVLNISLGGPGSPGVPEFFQALVDMANAAGAVVVAAAGNTEDSVRTYPAACNGVIAVAATDYSNQRASFSKFGSWVDLAAPGDLLWSSICRNYPLSDFDSFFYQFIFGYDGVRPYMYGSGTSFSCPLVAGLCALLRSQFPALTPAQVRDVLVATGDFLAFDQPIGPKVNAYRALVNAVAVERPAVAARPALEPARPNPSAGPTALRFVLGAAGPVSLEVLDCAGRRVRRLLEGTLAAGPHEAAWDGRDDMGRPVAGGLYFARLESAAGVATGKLVRLGR